MTRPERVRCWGARLVRIGVVLGVALSLACSVASAALEDEVRAFEAADALSPPPPGATLFVGSSSIRGWTNLAASFPGHTVLNRGFGGSQMSDLLAYFDRLVVPYAPPLMVVYEGDNDLATPKSVAEVFSDYEAFTNRAEHRLPGTEIIFLAVKPSPSRMAYLPKVTEFNTLWRNFCANKPHLRFVDVATPMLGDNGAPRPELYQSDQLHMVAAGYALWASLIEPVLAEAPFVDSRHWLIDFGADQAPTVHGPVPADPANAWNNVPAAVGTLAGGSLSELRTIEGATTEISLVVSRPFAGANEAGAGAGALFPDAAGRDSLYGHREEFNGQNGILPAVRLNGLLRTASYTLTFFASRTGVTDNRETVYTVTGAESRAVTLDAANNLDRVATLDGMVPDADGGISIDLAPGPANTSPQQFAYLGVLKIEERAPATPVRLLEFPMGTTAESGQSAVFRARATGSAPLEVQWFRNDEPIAGATDWTFEIPVVTEAMSGTRYRVRVSNAVSEAISGDAVLLVVPDTTPPVPLRASTTDGVVVEILFSEMLNPDQAPALAQFSAYDGLVPVTAAQFLEDGRSLVLTLAHRVAGTVPITLGPLTDRAGNAVASGTVVSVDAPVRRPRTFLFDFGASGFVTGTASAPANDPVQAWNNVTNVGLSNGGRLEGLKAADGQMTTVNLLMISRFNGANENGTLSAPGLPSNVSRDSLFGNTESFNGLSNVFPSFKLTGLAPDVPVDFTFYASRTGVGDNRETGYSVEGASSGFAALNVANNVGTVADVRGVLPTAGGEIVIRLSPTAANTNANHFTYLGMMRVRSAEPLEWRDIRRLTPTTLVLDWVGDARIEWAEDLKSEVWNPIVPAPSPPWFEDISREPARYYRLRTP